MSVVCAVLDENLGVTVYRPSVEGRGGCSVRASQQVDLAILLEIKLFCQIMRSKERSIGNLEGLIRVNFKSLSDIYTTGDKITGTDLT